MTLPARLSFIFSFPLSFFSSRCYYRGRRLPLLGGEAPGVLSGGLSLRGDMCVPDDTAGHMSSIMSTTRKTEGRARRCLALVVNTCPRREDVTRPRARPECKRLMTRSDGAVGTDASPTTKNPSPRGDDCRRGRIVDRAGFKRRTALHIGSIRFARSTRGTEIIAKLPISISKIICESRANWRRDSVSHATAAPYVPH